jgi:hypothetical protein
VWEVEFTDQFEVWWSDLTEEQQEALDDRVMLLAEHGPNLKRPWSEGSNGLDTPT